MKKQASGEAPDFLSGLKSHHLFWRYYCLRKSSAQSHQDLPIETFLLSSFLSFATLIAECIYYINAAVAINKKQLSVSEVVTYRKTLTK